MRALIHTSCLRIISRPKSITLVRITYFRARSLSTIPSWIEESIDLPIGNTGSISLSVTRPWASHSPSESQEPSQGRNVILYLPPGPLFQGHATPVKEEIDSNEHSNHQRWTIATASPSSGISPQQALASMTSATVVTVNYRLGAISPMTLNNETTQTLPLSSPSFPSSSSFYKYPAPIHDTLAAFDWVQTTLHPSNLGIIGSHVGGSLGLMLALTEAQSVKAVASIMPVCDWPGLDDYCTTEQASTSSSEISPGRASKRASTKKNLRASAPSDLVPLLAARESFFASPERCFDAFASPILFLRSAGRDVPATFPVYRTGAGYPVPVLKEARRDVGDASLLDPEFDPLNAEDDGVAGVEGHTSVRRRKALSRWPPYGLDYGAAGRGWGGNGVRRLEVTLPWVRVYVEGVEGQESGSVLADQGEEMVSVMRRACFFGREKGFGERRVGLVREFRGMSELGEDIGGWFEGIFDGRIRDE